MHKFVFYIV